MKLETPWEENEGNVEEGDIKEIRVDMTGGKHFFSLLLPHPLPFLRGKTLYGTHTGS